MLIQSALLQHTESPSSHNVEPHFLVQDTITGPSGNTGTVQFPADGSTSTAAVAAPTGQS